MFSFCNKKKFKSCPIIEKTIAILGKPRRTTTDLNIAQHHFIVAHFDSELLLTQEKLRKLAHHPLFQRIQKRLCAAFHLLANSEHQPTLVKLASVKIKFR